MNAQTLISLGRSLLPVLLRRGGQALAVGVLVGMLSFLMMRWLPGDFAYRIAAGRYGYDLVSAEAAEAVRRELALDAPWYVALAGGSNCWPSTLATRWSSVRRWSTKSATSSAIH